ncbi:hypothetical protein AAVH_05784 [Aphelenchoides avenae]|nr:hypothetical protein AAVH_05784 [Aphelenchus avenae]
MLTGDDQITFDHNGIPFIDRDSKHFSTILDALRDGAVVSLTADKQLLLEILSEAIFYKIKVSLRRLAETTYKAL